MATRGALSTTGTCDDYPTIYVLDAEGVIRHEGLRGEKLKKAVNDLLADQARATAAG